MLKKQVIKNNEIINQFHKVELGTGKKIKGRMKANCTKNF